MASLNYTKRLSNIQNRKFDKELNESLVSRTFSSNEIPENVKYLVESMRPMPQKSTDKTLDAANRVQKHLEGGLKLGFNRAYKTQGSVKTNTHIKASDFDFLTIIDSYYFNAAGVSTKNPYAVSKPEDDILELRKQSVQVLRSVYDEVDNTPTKNITVTNKSLNRKIDVVFAFWYHPNRYMQTNNEVDRGVYLFEFPTKKKIGDLPFAHMSEVNYKGTVTSDGSRRAIRLLKNLKEDSDIEIKKVKGFHLTTIVHSIANGKLYYVSGSEMSIARATSEEMGRIITDPIYRRQIKSPNATENPLADDALVPELKLIKADLDELIKDSEREIYRSPAVNRAMLSYQL